MVGKRIKLIYTNDPYTNLVPGDVGVVAYVDDFGTLHIDWDNGSKLGLLPDEDRYQLMDD